MLRVVGADVEADANGAGKDGFRAGTPGVEAGTEVTAPWANGVQEDLCVFAEAFGISPDLQGLATQMDYVYGVFKYGYMMPGHMQIHIAQGDTFFPYHKIPESIFLVDTVF